MKRITAWLFAAPEVSTPIWRTILWWELRRIPFNIIVGIYGFVCLMIFFVAIGTSGHLEPGEDAIEPMALFIAPFVINALYTLGWLVEVPTRLAAPTLSSAFGPRLLKLGLGLGMVLITLPAALWTGISLLHAVGAIK